MADNLPVQLTDSAAPLCSTDSSKQLHFIGDKEGEITSFLTLTNRSDFRQVFKVKCTKNNLFRIRPPMGILDYKETTTIAITYNNTKGDPLEEKQFIGVYHIPAPEGCTPEGCWAEHYGPAQGELRLEAIFEENKSQS